jgi:ceramide glucosyltransferase
MRWLWPALALLALLERAWKHWAVVRFFRRPALVATSEPVWVSILQPILSGDPTLKACLEANLRSSTTCRREFLWLVDNDDLDAHDICAELVGSYRDLNIQIISQPPPPTHSNPKMVKLIVGARLARGDVLCVLDDDTRLPDGALELCLPYLAQPGVGLAFGLPFYVNFGNRWSSLLSVFVNSHSLLTYIPYTTVAQPFTINGMFYALRRDVFDAVGGFDGLETQLADDFAVAQRVRAGGFRLCQTPLRHAISTEVAGPRHYLSLIRRWMIFPRESLMRQLGGSDRAVLYALGLAPAIFPLIGLFAVLLRPSRSRVASLALFMGYRLAIVAHLNAAYLGSATPWWKLWLVPLVELIFPLQLVSALLSPRRINWRGHLMEAERGGTFRIVRRR